MGHRANYVVKERGLIEIAYDHWGAKDIPHEVSNGFAAFMTEFFFKHDGHTALVDEIWCEGAVAVDIDRKQLIFFGGEECGNDRK